MKSYYDEFSALVSLTEKALSSQPQTDLVVWPETAFVPDILYHYYHTDDIEAHELVRNLIAYLEQKSCAFVIGNNYMDNAGKAYNSVLFFEAGRNVIPPRPEIYSKMRLVPFSEYLPAETAFLQPFFGEKDSSWWTPGNTVTVFRYGDIPFATPVCFEDTIPSQVRAMKKEGARLIVNLSNDSWSQSLACQYQHLSMAAFRSAENGIPSVRSTASGQTCVIDSLGQIVAEAPAFTACSLCSSVSVKLLE